jgi:SAM-dependent methyltransferase
MPDRSPLSSSETVAPHTLTAAEHFAGVRAQYDVVAADYADVLRGMLADDATDRAVLSLFAELVQRDGGGLVGDLGCGPGRITPYLAGLGLHVFGVDLSPGMIEVARRDHPHLRFEVGSMAALDLPDQALSGALAWYSLIHTPTRLLPEVLAELHRVLAPGGRLMVAFQVGQEPRHIAQAYGHEMSLDNHRRTPEVYETLLSAAGFAVTHRLVREPADFEKEPQAFLLARRPPPPPT